MLKHLDRIWAWFSDHLNNNEWIFVGGFPIVIKQMCLLKCDGEMEVSILLIFRVTLLSSF